jgi:hypothetical protein
VRVDKGVPMVPEGAAHPIEPRRHAPRRTPPSPPCCSRRRHRPGRDRSTSGPRASRPPAGAASELSPSRQPGCRPASRASSGASSDAANRRRRPGVSSPGASAARTSPSAGSTSLLLQPHDPDPPGPRFELKVYEELLRDDQVHSTFQQRGLPSSAGSGRTRAAAPAAPIACGRLPARAAGAAPLRRSHRQDAYGAFYGWSVRRVPLGPRRSADSFPRTSQVVPAASASAGTGTAACAFSCRQARRRGHAGAEVLDLQRRGRDR